MKISKKSINSSENIETEVQSKEQSEVKANEALIVEDPTLEEVAEAVVTEECCCKYDKAINLIQCAIESLAEIAKGDEVAKDSIANLGVVLLDLKGEFCQ